MSSAQLNVLLTTGAPSIVFDARPDPYLSETTDPFFRHSLLKNAILLKTGEGASGLRTKLYLPFDSARASRGGVSMNCEPQMTAEMLETFFGVTLDRSIIDPDLRKLEVLARTPSFAPFLVRDAFERSGLKVDVRHFKVSDTEVLELKGLLKAKLKPLAAMALSSGSDVGNSKLDVLVGKLWDLNDPGFLAPFTAALQIPPGESVDVLYSWIGVSYFYREFTKRQALLRTFAEWLVSKPPFATGVRDEVIAQFEADRKPVRDRVRSSWTVAGGIFDRYNSSYDKLIQSGDPSRFIEYLTHAREDFVSLGGHLAFIEQALCIFQAIQKERKGSQLSLDLLRELSASMRGLPRDQSSGRAAA